MQLLKFSTSTLGQLRQILGNDKEAFTLVYSILFLKWLQQSDDHNFDIPLTKSLLRGISLESDILTTFIDEMKTIQGLNPELGEVFRDTIYILERSVQSSQITNIITEFSYIANSPEFSFKERDFSQSAFGEELSPQNFFVKFIEENSKTLAPIILPDNLAFIIGHLVYGQPYEKIYVPNSSYGKLILEISSMYDRFEKQKLSFQGNEINTFSIWASKILFCVNDLRNVIVSQVDPIAEYEQSRFEEFDLAVGVPPFNRAISWDYKRILDSFHSPLKIKSANLAYLELMRNSVHSKGKVISIIPEGLLINQKEKHWREYYLRNDLIESIISLPTNVFNPFTNIKTSLIVINKDKPYNRKGKILFQRIGPSTFSDPEALKKAISLSKEISSPWSSKGLRKGELNERGVNDLQIQDLDYRTLSLSAEQYAHKHYYEIKDILESTEFEQSTIKDLLFKDIQGNYQKVLSVTNKTFGVTKGKIPLVRVRDLSSAERGELEVNLGMDYIDSNSKKKAKILREDAILVSKIGKKLNPVIFSFSGTPIALGQDVVGLVLKPEIDTEFFQAQLNSRLVEIQVEMLSIGTTINRINLDDLLNISVIIPPIAEQKREILELKSAKKHREKVEQLKEEYESEISDTEFNVVATISHNLNQKLGQINQDFNSIQSFLRRKNDHGDPINLGEPIAPVFKDESSSAVEKVSDVLSRFENTIIDASKTLKTTEKILQKNSLDLERVYIRRFFKEIENSFPSSNFHIETSGPNIQVDIDKSAFKDAIRNLIENAKKHGFVDQDVHYAIIFTWEVFEDRNTETKWVKISYRNNGKAFPKDFSFEEFKRLTGRAGKNRGSGLGGFWIDKVIKLHNGRFNNLDNTIDKHSSFNVHFEIIIPQKHKKHDPN